MSWNGAIVISICLIIMIVYIQQSVDDMKSTNASFDDRAYFVQDLEDKQEAANYLARIAAALTSLVRHMAAKYPDNSDVRRMYTRFDPNALSEGSIESGYTSYSVNKGKKIVLCIRQEDKTFVDFNTMLYVAIHELAHVMTLELDHPPQFWSNFKFLLEEATSINLYHNKDSSADPLPYCGINITLSV